MNKIVNLVGTKIGKLQVLTLNERERGSDGKLKDLSYHCLCECGNECDISAKILRTGRRKTCGICKSTMAERHLLKMKPTFASGYDCCLYPTDLCKFSKKGHCCHSCSWFAECEDRCNNTPERCTR